MAVNTSNLPVRTSMPEFVSRHNISDEELSMLCEGRKDMVLEFLWVSLGLAFGSAAAALSALSTYASATTGKMPLDDLIQIILFFVGIAASVVLGIVSFNRGKRSKDLQDLIRARAGGVIPA